MHRNQADPSTIIGRFTIAIIEEGVLDGFELLEVVGQIVFVEGLQKLASCGSIQIHNPIDKLAL